MSDIVNRLRDRAYGSKFPDPLLEEAADEIARLRGSTVEQRFCKPPIAGSTPAAGSLRDTFAASALGGLLAASDPNSWADDLWADDICRTAFGWADSMLQVRNGAVSGCETVQSKTNHDAAPAAIAAPSVSSVPLGKGLGTGKQPAPPCVETDGFSSGSSSELINRKAERQSPDRECGESSLRDVPQLDNSRAAGGPEHPISEAQIDALECVRPEWEGESDRSQPINADRLAALEQLSAQDQELELKHGITGNPMIKAQRRTPDAHATPTQGSVQCKGGDPRSGTENEPVAWGIERADCGSMMGFCHTKREATSFAHSLIEATGSQSFMLRHVPLYRQPKPALTETEAETLRELRDEAAQYADEIGLCSSEVRMRQRIIDSMLERLR